MIVVMCGLPQSGKSTVVDQIFNTDDHFIIRPSDYIPQNVENIPEDKRKKINVEAWNVALEIAREFIHDQGNDDIIVLDMCNRRYTDIGPMLRFGKRHGHRLVIIVVNCPIDQCQSRSAELDRSIFSNYVDSLKESLPKYKGESDDFLVVQNKGSLEDLVSSLDPIRDKLCLSTSTQTPTT
jgi:predicted kinase